MTEWPPVTIVTPTMPRREELLVTRCIASVQAQVYAGVIDHVIVSDRNPGLRERVLERVNPPENRPIQVVEINDTWLNNLTRRSTGSFPWRHGALMAHGDFVGFLGDDDEFLDHHVRVSVKTMDVEETDFSVCQVDFYGHGNYVLTIGHPLLGLGHMDATGVMCRREALRTANWDTPPLEEPDANAGDWRMVRDWRAAGLKGSFIGAVGGRHHDGWLTGYPS